MRLAWHGCRFTTFLTTICCKRCAQKCVCMQVLQSSLSHPPVCAFEVAAAAELLLPATRPLFRWVAHHHNQLFAACRHVFKWSCEHIHCSLVFLCSFSRQRLLNLCPMLSTEEKCMTKAKQQIQSWDSLQNLPKALTAGMMEAAMSSLHGHQPLTPLAACLAFLLSLLKSPISALLFRSLKGLLCLGEPKNVHHPLVLLRLKCHAPPCSTCSQIP